MKRMVTVQFEQEIVDKVEKEAKQNYRSLAAQIRLIVEDYVNKVGEQETKF